MSDKCMIHVHEKGHSSGDTVLKTAMEFAKHEDEKLSSEMNERLNEEISARKAAVSELADVQSADKAALEAAQKNHGEAIAALQQTHNEDISELKSAVTALDDEIAAECESIRTTYAGTEQAGLIRLGRDGSGANKSGLAVDQNDGTCNVYCDPNYGTQRTGGRVATAPATEAEISAQTQEYKPIVPKTLKYAVNTVVGDTIDEINETITEHDSTLAEQDTRLLAVEQKASLNHTELYELARESLRVMMLPKDEGLDVEATGAYIDTAGIANDNGLCRPGVLLVFNVDQTMGQASDANEVYKWYLSYQGGIYVKDGNTWKSV